MVRTLTRRDHHDHIEEISQQMGSNLWRWLKNVRRGSAGIPNLQYMGNVLTTAVEKAKVFNRYFCSNFTKENIKSDHLSYRLYGVLNRSLMLHWIKVMYTKSCVKLIQVRLVVLMRFLVD